MLPLFKEQKIRTNYFNALSLEINPLYNKVSKIPPGHKMSPNENYFIINM